MRTLAPGPRSVCLAADPPFFSGRAEQALREVHAFLCLDELLPEALNFPFQRLQPLGNFSGR